MTKTEEKSASNTNLWVVGGSSSVGILFREFQNLQEEDERFASRGDMMGKMPNTDEKIAGGEDGIEIPVDDSEGTVPVQTNGGGDVHAQAPIDDGGDDVSVDDGGGAAQVQADECIDSGGAIGVPVEERGGAVPVPCSCPSSS